MVTVPYVREHFGHIIVPGSLPIEGIAVIIEYLCLNEKRAEGAHQFRLEREFRTIISSRLTQDTDIIILEEFSLLLQLLQNFTTAINAV